MSSTSNFGYASQRSSTVAPSPSFRSTISTGIRVPLTTGLPNMTFGLISMRFVDMTNRSPRTCSRSYPFTRSAALNSGAATTNCREHSQQVRGGSCTTCSTSPARAGALSPRLCYLLVDEYQDTEGSTGVVASIVQVSGRAGHSVQSTHSVRRCLERQDPCSRIGDFRRTRCCALADRALLGMSDLDRTALRFSDRMACRRAVRTPAPRYPEHLPVRRGWRRGSPLPSESVHAVQTRVGNAKSQWRSRNALTSSRVTVMSLSGV